MLTQTKRLAYSCPGVTNSNLTAPLGCVLVPQLSQQYSILCYRLSSRHKCQYSGHGRRNQTFCHDAWDEVPCVHRQKAWMQWRAIPRLFIWVFFTLSSKLGDEDKSMQTPPPVPPQTHITPQGVLFKTSVEYSNKVASESFRSQKTTGKNNNKKDPPPNQTGGWALLVSSGCMLTKQEQNQQAWSQKSSRHAMSSTHLDIALKTRASYYILGKDSDPVSWGTRKFPYHFFWSCYLQTN